jgi:hypothetical protein
MRPIVVANCIYLLSSPAFSSVIFPEQKAQLRATPVAGMISDFLPGCNQAIGRGGFVCVVYFDPFPALSAQTAQRFVWRRVITVCFCHLHTVGQTPPRDGREVAPTDRRALLLLCCWCWLSDRCSSCQMPPKAMRRSHSSVC